MSPVRIIVLVVAAFLVLGGFGISAQSNAQDPAAVTCFVVGGVLALGTVLWRFKR